MTQTELANELGITQGYLSSIYNGKCRPGWKLAERWKPITRRTFDWWQKAKQAEIQKLLNRIGGNGNV